MRLEAAVLAAVPEAQNEDRGARDLVAQIVIADDDPPDFAWLVGFQFFADSRIVEQAIRRARQLLRDPRRRLGSNRTQLFV